MSKDLFSTVTIGNLTLQNRMVMAPMTRCRAINNIPNDLMATYYAQRAGAGLIITEGTSPSANGLGYPRIPGIFTQAQIEGWKLVTSAVHEKDGKIFLQIMHVGRVAHPDNMPEDAEMIAPSAIAAEGEMYTDENGPQKHPTPRPMTKEDIKQAVEEYAQAAKNAIEAGFDGVELHGANGYLIDQFINPSANQRNDEYGGSIENRSRFLLEVIDATIAAIGNEKVGIRLSPYGVFNDMGIHDDLDEIYAYIAQALNKRNILYVHLVDHTSMGAPEVPKSVVKKIREAFKGQLILSGGYQEKEKAEEDIKDMADLIAFGRPFLANPDLVKRLKHDIDLNEPNQDTFYTPGKEGYTDYPHADEVVSNS
ncbi:MAG: alkene reductase [Thermonemataceae bacterium]